MNIFFPDTHIYSTQSMVESFKRMGHTLILPSNEYKPCRYPKWHNPATAKVWNEYWTQEKAEKEIGSNVRYLPKSDLNLKSYSYQALRTKKRFYWNFIPG